MFFFFVACLGLGWRGVGWMNGDGGGGKRGRVWDGVGFVVVLHVCIQEHVFLLRVCM